MGIRLPRNGWRKVMMWGRKGEEEKEEEEVETGDHGRKRR